MDKRRNVGKILGVVLLVLMFLGAGLAPAFATDNTAENIGKLKIKKLDKIEQKFVNFLNVDYVIVKSKNLYKYVFWEEIISISVEDHEENSKAMIQMYSILREASLQHL